MQIHEELLAIARSDRRHDMAAVQSRLQASRIRFVNQFHGNPEMNDAAVMAVLQVYTRCEEALQSLADGVPQAAAHLSEAATRLRSVQKAYVASMGAMGPTRLPDVNRVCFHARNPSDARFLRLALDDVVHMEKRTLADLDEREKRCIFSDARPQATAAARAMSELAQQAIEQGPDADLDALQAGLVKQAQRLSEAMARYLAAEASSGPTGSPMVNVVLAAVQNLENGVIEQDDLRDLVRSLLTMLPSASPLLPPLQQLADEVRPEALRQLERLGDSVGPDGMELDEDDDNSVDFVDRPSRPASVSLPRNLQEAVAAVEAYLEQPLRADAAERAVEALAERIAATRTALDPPGIKAEKRTVMTTALAVMDQAVEALRTAVSGRSRGALEEARKSLAHASEILSPLRR